MTYIHTSTLYHCALRCRYTTHCYKSVYKQVRCTGLHFIEHIVTAHQYWRHWYTRVYEPFEDFYTHYIGLIQLSEVIFSALLTVLFHKRLFLLFRRKAEERRVVFTKQNWKYTQKNKIYLKLCGTLFTFLQRCVSSHQYSIGDLPDYVFQPWLENRTPFSSQKQNKLECYCCKQQLKDSNLTFTLTLKVNKCWSAHGFKNKSLRTDKVNQTAQSTVKSSNFHASRS